MYCGGFLVLQKPDNPEYIVQSAHSFRELLEKLPEISDEVYVDIKGSRDKFQNSLHQGLSKWEVIQFKTVKDLPEQVIINAIDTLNTLKKERGMIETRKHQFTSFIKHEYSNSYELSNDYLDKVFKQRNTLFKFFVSVCHHQKIVGIEEFLEKIDVLNNLLRSLFVKSPTADTNEIDSLL